MRSAKELLIASREFASESVGLSWWYLLSTVATFSGAIGLAVSGLPLMVRLAASLTAGFVAVRMFIIYHDYLHGAILRNSRIASVLMRVYGILTLAPSSVWHDSHDEHHKNNSQMFAANVGSYPIMTTKDYTVAGRTERLAYAVSRHPLTILFGYLTVFLYRMCARPFMVSPRRHLDGGVAVLVHLLLLAWMAMLGVDVLVLGMLIPFAVASALGAYLFYAQHNYPSARMMTRAEWNHVDAALHSSSFIKMNPLMTWFTGSIGYHHVHHLNARIPFYRLAEAMAGLEELQSPGTTSLKVRDVAACLRLKLWSPEHGKFVGFTRLSN